MRTTDGTTGAGTTAGLVVLPESDWTAREAAHHTRVDALTAGHRERAGGKHPVEDFLWTYYSQRPAQLRRWHPGAGVALAGAAADGRAAWRDHVRTGAGVTLDVPGFLARRADAVRHVRDLLAATASRPVHLGCFGLHEWAMVYRLDASDVRHAGLPLRLGSAGTDEVVESHRIRCSHFDAFRFFTAEARPLNTLQPRREDQVALDQPGCLHATMDLYKWSAKYAALVGSDLVADCFALALDARVLDMDAAPYDLSALGREPVRVETPEGRAEYVRRQRELADRGAVLRARLVTALSAALDALPG